MLRLKVTLFKEVQSVQDAQILYDQLKVLVAPKEPIVKDARVVENHVLT